MWSRAELKARGKAAFKANYWRCVLVALIITAILGGGAGGSQAFRSRGEQSQAAWDHPSYTEELVDADQGLVRIEVDAGSWGAAVFPWFLGGSVVLLVLGILVINPLQVGCDRFFLENGSAPADLGEVAYAFRNRYYDAVTTMLLKDVFLFLWSLLVIPGIVKSYSYRMVPYILADEPGISGTDAITLSRQMMLGHKWETFVLDLSFLGWHLLGAVTLGLVEIFYAAPYEAATDAELYRALAGR